ncbi:CHAT domain-containing protein, partial [Actinoplanes sp. Pm04-4]
FDVEPGKLDDNGDESLTTGDKAALTDGETNEQDPGLRTPVSGDGPPPSGETPGDDPQPQRVLVGQMPAQVRDGSEVSLIVHIARSVPVGPRTRSTLMKPWPIPADGSDVTVVVHADNGLIPLGPVQQVIRVPASSDSDPVRFAFRASQVDVSRVEVTTWAGGKYLAKLTFEVSVTDRGPNLEPTTKVATVNDVDPEAGAVTLQIHHADGRYTFQLHNDQCVYDPVMVAVEAGADGVLSRARETLRRFAMDTKTPPYSPAVAREWLQNTGVGLWNSIVPEAIREQYLQLHSRISTFSIATGNDALPWELLYPMTKTHDAGFLVDQFPVTRTVFNTDRSRRINLGGARFVEAARSPANASAEFKAIGRIVAPGQELTVVNNLNDLLHLFASGEAGLTHFACHATYRNDGSGASISMCDGDFTPMMLATAKAKETLTAGRPLVFINACRSAGAEPYFTEMMGWAQQFLGAGAGAFVGTLWDVRSTSAQNFAEEFYGRLMTGQTLGLAAMHARKAVKNDMDPTWLAYTVYGDANALAFQ